MYILKFQKFPAFSCVGTFCLRNRKVSAGARPMRARRRGASAREKFPSAWGFYPIRSLIKLWTRALKQLNKSYMAYSEPADHQKNRRELLKIIKRAIARDIVWEIKFWLEGLNQIKISELMEWNMRKILVIISSFYDHHRRRYSVITFSYPVPLKPIFTIPDKLF